MELMVAAVHGRIAADAAADEMVDLNGDVLSQISEAQDFLADGGDDDGESEWFDRNSKQAESGIREASPGPALYEALRAYEKILANTMYEWRTRGWIPQDDDVCTGTVGFTESASRFVRVDPDQVGLLLCAGRRTANVEIIPNECELRFRPHDLAVVGVWKMKSGRSA